MEVQELLTLPLKLISFSRSNPRKSIDEAKLAELAESIKQKGVLQPVLVRPHAGRGAVPNYELVAGERRCRAAKLAGLDRVPAIVRELSDVQVLEVQVIENEQRDDTSPLEKAEGYAALVQKHGLSVADVAARIGKSPATVRNLLRLAGQSLPQAAAAALAAGDIPAATAGLIARIPNPAHRERVTQYVLCGTDWWNSETFNDPKHKVNGHGRTEDAEPLSYRDTKELIAECCQVELKGAPFDRQALDLVAGAGDCGHCPKRVGNLQQTDEEYRGARADVCTDPACYRAKCEAHRRGLRAKLEAEGATILSAKQSKALFCDHALGAHASLRHDAGYVRLDESCYEDPKRRTYQRLMGKELAGQLVYAEDRDGRLHALAPQKEVGRILKQKFGRNVAGDWGSSYRRQGAARRKKAMHAKEAARVANGQVADLVALQCRMIDSKRGNEFLQALAEGVAEIAWSDACRQVVKRRGLKVKKNCHQDAVRDLARGCAEPRELMGLIAELVAARISLSWASLDTREKRFWAIFGVDRAALLKQAESGSKALPAIVIDKNRDVTKAPVTRETVLADLLGDGDGGTIALIDMKRAGFKTVGDLVDDAERAGQTVYSRLRRTVPGLSEQFICNIGDAIADGDVDNPAANSAAKGNGYEAAGDYRQKAAQIGAKLRSRQKKAKAEARP